MPDGKDIAVKIHYLTEGAERAKAIAEDIDKTVLAGRTKALDLNRQILEQREALTTTTDKGWRTRRENLIAELRLQREGVAQGIQEQRLEKDKHRPIQAVTQAQLKAVKTEQMATMVRETYLRYSYLSGIALNEMGKAFGKTNAEIQANGEIINKVTRRTMTEDDVVTELKGTYRRFRMELLSVMFAGMAVSKAYDSMIKPAKELTGQTQMWTTTLQVAFLPAVAATTPAVLGLQMSIMELNESTLKWGGITMMAVGWAGKAMMTVGMFGLGVDGLRQFFAKTTMQMKAHNEMMIALTGRESELINRKRGLGRMIDWVRKKWHEHQMLVFMNQSAMQRLTGRVSDLVNRKWRLGRVIDWVRDRWRMHQILVSMNQSAMQKLGEFIHRTLRRGFRVMWEHIQIAGVALLALIKKLHLTRRAMATLSSGAAIGALVGALVALKVAALAAGKVLWVKFASLGLWILPIVAVIVGLVLLFVYWDEIIGTLTTAWTKFTESLGEEVAPLIEWGGDKLDALKISWDEFKKDPKGFILSFIHPTWDAFLATWNAFKADPKDFTIKFLYKTFEDLKKSWEDFKKDPSLFMLDVIFNITGLDTLYKILVALGIIQEETKEQYMLRIQTEQAKTGLADIGKRHKEIYDQLGVGALVNVTTDEATNKLGGLKGHFNTNTKPALMAPIPVYVDKSPAVKSLEALGRAFDDLKEKFKEVLVTSIIHHETTYRKIFELVVPYRIFQHGGIVTKPTLGLIGEAGPEAVIPLNQAKKTGAITVNANFNQSYYITTTSEFDLDEKLREHDRELVSQIQALVRR